MTQTEAILRHLQVEGSISPIEALERYGCFRLAARISDLKALGHPIETEIVKRGRKSFAVYRLVSEPQQMVAGF